MSSLAAAARPVALAFGTRGPNVNQLPNIPPPPKLVCPDFERMPPELKQENKWVLWGLVWNGTKWTKRPVQASGFGASTTNTNHWSSFEDVKKAYERAIERGYIDLREKEKRVQLTVGGVGFVFDGQPDENGLVFAGVDFDGLLGDDIGSFAEEWVKRLGSYFEASVSGTGLHVILKARPLSAGITHKRVEMYTSGRFFTMTGRTGPATRPVIVAPGPFLALANELRAKIDTLRSDDPVPTASLPENGENTADVQTTTWFNRLPVQEQSEVVKHAALHIANNSELFELTAHGGNYQDYLRLGLAIARSGVPNAEDIFVEAAATAKGADPEQSLREFFRNCKCAERRTEGTTVGTLFYLAHQHGADFSEWKQPMDEPQDLQNGVTLADFHAYMPGHTYIFTPSRELWPATSVNSRLGRVLLCGADGKPVLDQEKNNKKISASEWLDRNRPVEQMTWAPGLPEVIEDRLILEGGWVERNGVTCFNLYLPPTNELGNAQEASPWLDHVCRVYGRDADHILKWLAHRTQRPSEKINHALVFGGNQGIGKDTLLQPVKYAVGPWNFLEVSPQHLLGQFNGFLKSVILRVNEARDLGDINRFQFYDHMKSYTAAPPDVLRVNEKHLREYNIINCCGVIITTNHKADGIYLPADDRRHFVAWSDLTKDDFNDGYWNALWGWYGREGCRHISAYLAELDISSFDPKAPPPKTPAFWDIVDASRAPEDAELADELDKMQNPDATTLTDITNSTSSDLSIWLHDRKNRRQIPHRMETCGYVPVRNDSAKDGLWIIQGKRQVVYAKSDLSISDRLKAASELARQRGRSLK